MATYAQMKTLGYPKPRRVLVDDPPVTPPKPPPGPGWWLCRFCNEWCAEGSVTMAEDGWCPVCDQGSS
jgi:hypothetical protein